MDISEHRALLTDECISEICISHIESSNIVYIMTEDDHERAIKLLEAMKCIDTIENEELFRYFVFKVKLISCFSFDLFKDQ